MLPYSRSAPAAHLLQQRMAWIAIGYDPHFLLIRAYGGRHLIAELSVDLADVEAKPLQVALQVHRLRGAQRLVVLRPGGGDRACAAYALAKMADAESVGVGAIVFLDDAEILREQEGGTVAAYLRKGRLSPLVEMTPLHLIKNNRAAMLGAAAIAANL